MLNYSSGMQYIYTLQITDIYSAAERVLCIKMIHVLGTYFV